MERKKEIREVREGEKGLLLEKTENHQKFHIVTKDSKVQVGDFVEAVLIKDADKYALYKCVTIPANRMVVRIVIPRGEPHSASYRWNSLRGSAESFSTDKIQPFIEVKTVHSTYYYYRGALFGKSNLLVLIKEGAEKSVREIFIRSQFRYFILEDMGLWNLHANGPRFQYKEGLRTYKDFEKAWRDHTDLLRNIGRLVPKSADTKGRAHVFTTEEWEVLIPHLAAWTEFVKMVRDNYEYIYEHHPPDIWPYCLSVSGGADHSCCLDCVLDKAMAIGYFDTESDITKESVIRLLAKTESVFPKIN